MEVRGRGARGVRRERMWLAAAGSLALHALIIVVLLAAEGFGKPKKPEPRMRSYAVNIVSPPPTLRGPPPAEAPAPNVGGNTAPALAAPPAAPPAAPTPAPPAAPKPAPAPAPPAPPKPAPPVPKPAVAPPKEPARTPQPTTPQPRPAATPPRPASPRPSTPPANQRPATPPPARPSTTTAAGTNRTTTTPKPNAAGPTERRPGASNGPGSGAASAGTGTRGAPTGRNPNPNSAGGEGLNVSQRGAECPSAGYCENIERQLLRFFRRPEGNNGSAEVCFTILRDGSTADDIEVKRVRGGFAFRMAVQEAAEQAGLRKAFGALPRGFGADEIRFCVAITPET
ncbi:MAG TPA: hypothetical protein VFJ16_09105 [Longimicrobium sp.]|nr:hypothetical protein [Longimicrobium sp.]